MNWSTASFWTHGVNTIAEFPERTIGIRKTGYGTIVNQVKGGLHSNNNWFHLPLHSVDIMDDELSAVEKVKFSLGLNKHVMLKEIHVRHGHELIYTEEVDLNKKEIIHEIDLSGTKLGEKLQNGIVLCLRFEFNDEIEQGEIIFNGAGIQYASSN